MKEHRTALVWFRRDLRLTDNPALMFDYEWQLWQTPIGKLGLRAGSGLYVAQGNGHFVHPSINPGKVPREVFTFVLVPANFGAIYRMQFWHRQLLVPYAEGGGTIFGFSEFRDDNKAPKWGGTFGAYFSGGVALKVRDVIEHAGERAGVPIRWRKLPTQLVFGAARLAEFASALSPGRPEPLTTAYSVALLAYTQTLDISAARRALGWAPRVSFAEGLARTFEGAP